MAERKQTEEKRHGKSRGFVRRMLPGLAVVTALAILGRFALDRSLTVREYTVTSPLVTGDHTFALLTDLHGTVYGEDQAELADRIREYEPEAVFLVGDISDEKHSFDGTAMLLRELKDLPMWFVTGNHEIILPYTDDVRELMREYGVRVLDSESAELDGGIRLSGVDDPSRFRGGQLFSDELKKLETSESAFDLLLAHRPDRIGLYRARGFDLILCGHEHGGQVRLPPLLNGLYASNEGWFPEYAGGQYDFPDGSCMIVSRGLVKNRLPRVFNPPEIVIVHVNEER